jgi:16S rRNA G966 N2-methylase RsmD
MKKYTYGTRFLHTNYINNKLLPYQLERDRKPFIPEVEPTLLKYNDYFWKKIFPYKKGINYSDYMLSNIGSYSIFYPLDSDKIAKIIRGFIPPNENATITDATANMGGATLAFSNYFNHVNAVEIIPFHCKILTNNIKVYRAENKVKVHCNDYLDIGNTLEQDVVFFDPPWGGPDYKNLELMDMYLDNIMIGDIIKSLIDKKKTKIIAIRVPFNYDFKKLLELTEKSYVYSFKKPNGKLNFFLIILIR